MAAGALVTMVVVVPAFAESHERKPRIVSALVGCGVSLFSPNVAEGIDRKSAVPEQNRADDKAPDESGQSADEKHGRAVNHDGNEMIVV